MSPAVCDFAPSKFLIIGENVAPLVYYSHIPVAILSLIIGIFVLSRGGRNIASRTFFVMTLTFSLWVFLDSIFWATNRSDLIMLVWALILLIEPIVHASGVYLMYQLIENKNPPFALQVFMGVIFIPLIVLVPTDLALSNFNLATCLAQEGPIALYYTYFVEIVLTIIAIAYAIMRFSASKSREKKLQVLSVSLGVIVLLFFFSWGNIIGSFTENWQLGQYGLFGLPIFTAILAYSITKFRLFNIKVVGANILVISLWVLIGSLLALQNIETIRNVVAVTFVISVAFGIMLIRSVRREVSLREQLQVSNEGQANLIHIINHQIKGYLAKSRNIFSELLTDKSYGACTDESKPMLDEGFKSLTEGVHFVKDFLDASNIEKGTYEFVKKPLDFKSIVLEIVDKQKQVAEGKGLSVDMDIVEGDYNMKGDKDQLSQAVRNLLDNSILYTSKGSIKVHLAKKGNNILLSIKDTGVGISEELKPKLFTKGGRDKNSLKININSTGFGLAFVKNVVVAHKGCVWADSPGKNMGSTFSVELPMVV